jgi:hypothetical protein
MNQLDKRVERILFSLSKFSFAYFRQFEHLVTQFGANNLFIVWDGINVASLLLQMRYVELKDRKSLVFPKQNISSQEFGILTRNVGNSKCIYFGCLNSAFERHGYGLTAWDSYCKLAHYTNCCVDTRSMLVQKNKSPQTSGVMNFYEKYFIREMNEFGLLF